MTEQQTLSPSQLRDLAIAALEDAKASDIQVIDLAERSTFADFMIICSGTSSRQVKAAAERVALRAKSAGVRPFGIEGTDECEWVLVDLCDVVVHVMQPQARAFYNLEKLWSAPPAATHSAQA
ncbi:ribosome silencing factor [Wenzhouxiangella sp. AB-CW3]|uniref:ribosome silencing factor n=1 Tax=Wenzhouxiangella sp. AB-CW3 TaxID=2771012 RepID=UPI00168B4F47|nr:ribosome silencing factor [Wenzhouxiangella sp. AB-CW3]QOC22101.1 ribosome silencing factor [Wenzhouxiangella sp. AB-CW3]